MRYFFGLPDPFIIKVSFIYLFGPPSSTNFYSKLCYFHFDLYFFQFMSLMPIFDKLHFYL